MAAAESLLRRSGLMYFFQKEGWSMQVLKILGMYVFGHLLCVSASRDGMYYNADYEDHREIWLLLALPSSLITYGHILAVRVACCINLGAIFIILYFIICSVSGISPSIVSDIHHLYTLWIFSALAIEFFRMERCFVKKETIRTKKFSHRFLMGVGFVASIVFTSFFFGYILMLFLRCK